MLSPESYLRTQALRAVPAEITPEAIALLVRAFYHDVQLDPLLGPVFAARVQDWDQHIARLSAFWSSVLLMSGSYSGNPRALHAPLPIGRMHFARWLQVFTATAYVVFSSAGAAWIVERAHRIGEALSANRTPHQIQHA